MEGNEEAKFSETSVATQMKSREGVKVSLETDSSLFGLQPASAGKASVVKEVRSQLHFSQRKASPASMTSQPASLGSQVCSSSGD